MKTVFADVAVIGAGPAGLAAAAQAKKSGAKRVVVLERNPAPGGILRQCIHDGFGLYRYGKALTGPEYAARRVTQPIDFQTLAHHPLILLESKSSSRRLIDNCFSEHGIILRPGIELGSHDLLLDFAAANFGIACVVEEFSRKALESGRVVRVDTVQNLPRRSVGIFTLRPRSTPATQALLELLPV